MPGDVGYRSANSTPTRHREGIGYLLLVIRENKLDELWCPGDLPLFGMIRIPINR